jgi:hypothetical protein
LLAENRFLQAGKGAKNTKEKSRQCFTCRGGIVVCSVPSADKPKAEPIWFMGERH